MGCICFALSIKVFTLSKLQHRNTSWHGFCALVNSEDWSIKRLLYLGNDNRPPSPPTQQTKNEKFPQVAEVLHLPRTVGIKSQCMLSFHKIPAFSCRSTAPWLERAGCLSMQVTFSAKSLLCRGEEGFQRFLPLLDL